MSDVMLRVWVLIFTYKGLSVTGHVAERMSPQSLHTKIFV